MFFFSGSTHTLRSIILKIECYLEKIRNPQGCKHTYCCHQYRSLLMIEIICVQLEQEHWKSEKDSRPIFRQTIIWKLREMKTINFIQITWIWLFWFVSSKCLHFFLHISHKHLLWIEITIFVHNTASYSIG